MLVTKQLRKLTADYLQTVSWDIVEAEVGWLEGWGLWGQSSHKQPKGPGLGPLLRLQVLQGTGLCYRDRSLILLVEELHFVAQTSEKFIHPTLLSVWEFLQILLHSLLKEALCTALPQLPVLDEASKHLRLHKNLKKTPDALGSHRLAEGLALKGPLPLLTLRQKEGVVPDGLHEEPDEHLRHQPIEGITF